MSAIPLFSALLAPFLPIYRPRMLHSTYLPVRAYLHSAPYLHSVHCIAHHTCTQTYPHSTCTPAPTRLCIHTCIAYIHAYTPARYPYPFVPVSFPRPKCPLFQSLVAKYNRQNNREQTVKIAKNPKYKIPFGNLKCQAKTFRKKFLTSPRRFGKLALFRRSMRTAERFGFLRMRCVMRSVYA